MTAGPSSPSSAAGAVVDLCDVFLREIGRREHRFAWLRAPDADADEWVAVGAYYPGNRVVVCCSEEPGERRLCEELVPQRGLYLLCVDPDELPEDPEDATRLLRDRLQEDGWSPRPAPRPVAASAEEPTPRERRVATSRPPPPGHGAGTGLGLGITLIVVAVLEAYLGVVVVAVNSSDPVLGVGLLLDACARVLGTVTAAQRHDDEATWGGLLIGSPVLLEHPKPTRTLAIAALVVTGLGILVAVL